jgi:hypothetical protein
MNDRVQQQTLHVDENMSFLAFDQFARAVLSWEAVKMRPLEKSKTAAVTPPTWPLRMASGLPSRSQSRAVWSSDAAGPL